MRIIHQVASVVAWLGVAAVAQAQAMPRDPTVPPIGGSHGPSVGTPGKPRPAPGVAVIMVDGRPHVMLGARLYGEGQPYGKATIERITETEVWLREGRELRKMALYPGVRRSIAPAQQP